MNLAESTTLSDDRKQPSAAEFMAFITVQVCTNLDLGGQARSGPKLPPRPDPYDYDRSTLEHGKGAPAGGGGEPDVQVAKDVCDRSGGHAWRPTYPLTDDKELSAPTSLLNKGLIGEAKKYAADFMASSIFCTSASSSILMFRTWPSTMYNSGAMGGQ